MYAMRTLGSVVGTLTLAVIVATQASGNESTTTAIDQPIMIEAESFTAQRNDDLRRWTVIPNNESSSKIPENDQRKQAAEGASNGAYIRLLPDTRVTHADKLIRGENFSPEAGKMAVISYPVEIPKAGRYYVWVRAFSTGSEDNGIHVGIDGEWPEHGQRMQWCEGKNTWRWQCAQRTEKQHCGVPMEIYLDIDAPGKKTIEFSMREDGFTMDQFLLTTDKNYRPE
ncbi:hypothetical protein [Aporhodopirellula aestuarii]|uniref:Gylcosyl hydrolase 115 C-terminal domain-containing protein n=1 Tax=Aporhodopirellula aestuarii TaxID=2950107 RepID=A0ABT0U0X9_9BACT|nr:hypothetical protein [Aporhodopirellula aestuarii]MCM2370531.1 hypothetical protein [Aporhodopirellula aestuarii]